MKYLAVLSATCITLSAFAQKEIVVNTQADKATLFLSGAQLFHTASLELPSGQSDIIIEGIANSIDQNSIEAGGTGNFTILDVQYKLFYPEPGKVSKEITETDKKIKLLGDSITGINFDLESVANQTDVFHVEQQMLLNNKLLQTSAGSDSLELIQHSIDYYNKKLNEIYAGLLDLEKKQLLLNDKKSDMQMRLADLQNYRAQQVAQENPNAPVPQIIISASADAATDAQIHVDYLTYQAGWYPTYDIRASDVSKPVELNYKANIWQNTGIDWKNIKITCSTGNPTQGNTLPALTAWYLGNYEMDYKKDDYNAAPSSRAEDKSEDSINGMLSKENADGTTATQASDFTTRNAMIANMEFSVNLPYSIPADGKGHIVALQTKTLPSSYNYLIVPKIEQSAFLIARITGWEDAGLLPGYSNIYFDNTYVGKTYLDPLALNDTLSVSLGRDNSIEVKRTQLLDKSSDKVIGLNDKKTMSYEIDVRNDLSARVEIILKDQIPVSEDDDIKVALINDDKGELDKDTGEITWRETLDPRQDKKYHFEFDITYPKNQPLTLE